MDNNEILKDYQKLLKENEYLKKLLKINNINYSLPLLSNYDENNKMNLDEKTDVFMSYFKGRDDCYTMRYKDKEENERYFKVCEKSFIKCEHRVNGCKKCAYRKNMPLTKDKYVEHLRGNKQYQIYPMLDKDICYFLAIDFDGEDFFLNAKLFKQYCNNYNIDCLIEITQTGVNAHCWIFFENAVKTKLARSIGDFILNKVYEKSNNININIFDRMYPSQDYLEKNSYGSTITLPLNGGELVQNGITAFVDDNKIAYDKQIAYLKTIKKIDNNTFENLIDIIEKENKIDSLKNKYIKEPNLKFSDFIGSLEITIYKDIKINKVNLTSKSLKYLMRLGCISNPKFYELQRARKSTYNIPRSLILFKEDDDYLYLPKGCLEDLITILTSVKVNYKIIDNRFIGNPIDVEFNGVLKDEQQIAVDKLLEHTNGILVAPPGFGVDCRFI